MFCPNCGAPNPETAVTCEKCGFNVKGAVAQKFKGTMLMMNQGAPPGVTPPMPVGAPKPAPATDPALANPALANSKLKGTMIGVAPPSAGAVAPPGGAPPAGVNPPGAPRPGGPEVNLGATMAAGAGQFGYGFPGSPGAGAPQAGFPGAPAGAPPAGPANTTLGVAPPPPTGTPHGLAPTIVDPGVTMAAAGSPMHPGLPQGGFPPPGMPGVSPQAAPPGFPAQGMPPGMPPQGMPPQGMPPQGMGAPGYAQAAQPGMMQAPQIGGAQLAGPPGYHQPGMPAGAAPYVPVAAATAPGQFAADSVLNRSPFGVFVLLMVTCGFYAFWWYAGVAKELRARGAEVPPVWHIFIPILGLIWLWKFCKGIDTVSRGRMGAALNLVMILFLGGIGMAVLQSGLRKL